MREKLNENPTIQLAVLGVVGLIFAVIMFTMVLKKEELPAAPPAAAGDPAVAPAVDPAVAPAPAGATAPAPEATPAPSAKAGGGKASAGGGKAASGLKAGTGLPKPVVSAFDDGKAIALLVYDAGGLADQPLKTFTKRLASRNDVAVFTVDARKIGKYSRITQGVNVSQAPALIVVKPLGSTPGTPAASVSYGFRNAKSVEVALDDALYTGPTRGSFPD